MKSSNFFFGALFIAIGFIWLNEYINLVDIAYSGYYKYWPLFLIFIGLSFIKLPKAFRLIISFISGLLTALILYSAYLHFNNMSDYKKDEIEEKIEKKLDEILEKDKQKVTNQFVL